MKAINYMTNCLIYRDRYHLDLCKNVFGEGIYPKVDATNLYYGGTKIAGKKYHLFYSYLKLLIRSFKRFCLIAFSSVYMPMPVNSRKEKFQIHAHKNVCFFYTYDYCHL